MGSIYRLILILFALLRGNVIWRHWKNCPSTYLSASLPAISQAILLRIIFKIISRFSFHVGFWSFVLLIESLDIVIASLQVILFHLVFAHDYLHFVIILKTVAVHLREVWFSGLLKFFDNLIIILVSSLNGRIKLIRFLLTKFGFEKAAHRILLNRALIFLVHFQIVFYFQNYLLGGFFYYVVFWDSCKCVGVHISSYFSRTILRFSTFIKNITAPHFRLVLLHQIFLIKRNRRVLLFKTFFVLFIVFGDDGVLYLSKGFSHTHRPISQIVLDFDEFLNIVSRHWGGVHRQMELRVEPISLGLLLALNSITPKLSRHLVHGFGIVPDFLIWSRLGHILILQLRLQKLSNRYLLTSVRRFILDRLVTFSSVHIIWARVPGGLILVQAVHTIHLLCHIRLAFRKSIFLKILTLLILILSRQRLLIWIGVEIIVHEAVSFSQV